MCIVYTSVQAEYSISFCISLFAVYCAVDVNNIKRDQCILRVEWFNESENTRTIVQALSAWKRMRIKRNKKKQFGKQSRYCPGWFVHRGMASDAFICAWIECVRFFEPWNSTQHSMCVSTHCTHDINANHFKRRILLLPFVNSYSI